MRLGPGIGKRILDALFRGVSVAPPSTVWLSAGTYASGSFTQLGTAPRVPMGLSRGRFKHAAGEAGIYADDTSNNIYFRLGDEFEISCAGLGAETENPLPLLWDAASGGDVYISGTPHATYTPRATADDVFTLSSSSFQAGLDTNTYPNTVKAEPEAFVASFQSPISPYVGAMLRDHFLRNIDAIGARWPASSYPNVFLNLANSTAMVKTSANNYAGRVAVPRTTAQWTAPAVDVDGSTYITNVNPISFGPLTMALPSTFYVQARLANTPQTFEDVIAADGFQLYQMPSGPTYTAAIGDTIVIAAGMLKYRVGYTA